MKGKGRGKMKKDVALKMVESKSPATAKRGRRPKAEKEAHKEEKTMRESCIDIGKENDIKDEKDLVRPLTRGGRSRESKVYVKAMEEFNGDSVVEDQKSGQEGNTQDNKGEEISKPIRRGRGKRQSRKVTLKTDTLPNSGKWSYKVSANYADNEDNSTETASERVEIKMEPRENQDDGIESKGTGSPRSEKDKTVLQQSQEGKLSKQAQEHPKEKTASVPSKRKKGKSNVQEDVAEVSRNNRAFQEKVTRKCGDNKEDIEPVGSEASGISTGRGLRVRPRRSQKGEDQVDKVTTKGRLLNKSSDTEAENTESVFSTASRTGTFNGRTKDPEDNCSATAGVKVKTVQENIKSEPLHRGRRISAHKEVKPEESGVSVTRGRKLTTSRKDTKRDLPTRGGRRSAQPEKRTSKGISSSEKRGENVATVEIETKSDSPTRDRRISGQTEESSGSATRRRDVVTVKEQNESDPPTRDGKRSAETKEIQFEESKVEKISIGSGKQAKATEENATCPARGAKRKSDDLDDEEKFPENAPQSKKGKKEKIKKETKDKQTNKGNDKETKVEQEKKEKIMGLRACGSKRKSDDLDDDDEFQTNVAVPKKAKKYIKEESEKTASSAQGSARGRRASKKGALEENSQSSQVRVAYIYLN